MSYLKELRQRNIELMHKKVEKEELNIEKKYHEGLTKPLSVKERKIRSRLTQKAGNMAHDLCLIFLAGVLPNRRIKNISPEGLIRDMSFGLIMSDLEKKYNVNNNDKRKNAVSQQKDRTY